MLVLTRKIGERIYIGNDILITIVDIDRGKIRIGIDAPRDIPIHRDDAHVKNPRYKEPTSADDQPAAG